MVWADVWAVIVLTLVSGGKRSGKLFVPAVLMLGVLPDVDLFWGSVGVVHETVTHSFFFWFILFAPFLVIFRLKLVPYLAAVVQHFAFGDLLVGKVMIFWPFSSSYFGFNIPMPSVMDIAIETAGLFLAAGIIILNGDIRRLLSVDDRNILMLLPFLALLASMLFFAVDWPIITLIAYVWSRKLVTAIVLEHLILVAFLAVSAVQGLKALSRQERARCCAAKARSPVARAGLADELEIRTRYGTVLAFSYRYAFRSKTTLSRADKTLES